MWKEEKLQKFEYFENEKRFLNKIKSILHSFLKDYNLVKKKADTSFKFLFKQLMTSQTLRFIFNQPLKPWLTGRKKGEDGNTKT